MARAARRPPSSVQGATISPGSIGAGAGIRLRERNMILECPPERQETARGVRGRSGHPYDAAFFRRQQADSLRSARIVVPLLMDLVRPRSVADFGCGVGAWLHVFLENGITDLLGIDGDYVDRSALLFDSTRFRATDLEGPVETLGRGFDMAVCLEVAEHLSARAAPRLIERLTNAAPIVLFSAALPGQGGTQHVNECWPGYWRRLFAMHGYDRLDAIRPRIWRERDVEWWFKQNTYLFIRRGVIESDAILREEAACAAANPFELIHEDVLGHVTTTSGLLRSMPRAALRSLMRWTSRRAFGRR